MALFVSDLDKQVARDILVAMIQKDSLYRKEFPGTDTTVDMIATAYKTLVRAVAEQQE